MAYNKRNLLLKIVEIQNITLEHTKRGVTQKWVFKNLIEPNYFISIRTYNEYIGRNAKKELSDLNRVKNELK